ncbi:hypothetical protein [Pseudomonas aeruginosa]|uniref:hypothetical protein n=1 Tax=Pseudomonas aeruginosa TaxID=287 RepID=UPI0008FAED96|nr:hypothetical protein [Pseudomonas aeruginosa]OPD84957.1 hypothetical protein AO948_33520 [Pseudomonas aeruginosa]
MNLFRSMFGRPLSGGKTGGLEQYMSYAIDYGNARKDGGHDHRTNKGRDRTPAQRSADSSKRK